MNLFWLIRALLSFRARACENIPRIPQDVATPETRDFLLSRAGLPKVGKGHNRQSSELWITDVKKKTPTSSFLVWVLLIFVEGQNVGREFLKKCVLPFDNLKPWGVFLWKYKEVGVWSFAPHETFSSRWGWWWCFPIPWRWLSYLQGR